MTKLRISDDLSLPVDAVTETVCILGIRGSGKTHTATVMVEEMLRARQPVCVYDPTGAWFGLKTSADGTEAGFPVVVFGGEHADVPLEEAAGETIARVIVEKRIPAVLDCSLMRKGARIRFMTDFCETLYHRNREPLHFVADEAHTLAPQKPFPEAAKLLGAIEDMVLQGRRRGLGLTVISQRPALLNTNVRTQCPTLIAMRIVGPHDLKAVKEWTDAHGSPEQAEQLLSSLPTLKTGEGWVWSPAWLDVFKRVQFRQRKTFDSSATPKVGQKAITPQVAAEIDLAALGEQIKATVDQAKANDPAALKRQIADLQKQLRDRPATAVPAKTVTERVEVPVLKNGQLDRTEKLAARLEAEGAKLRMLIAPAFAAKPAPPPPPPPPRLEQRPAQPPRPIKQPRMAPAEGEATPGKCHRAILRVLSQFPDGCEIGKLALLAGYHVSGGFRNALTDLRGWGFMDGENTATMRITDAGMEQGPFEPLPRGAGLADYWLNHRAFGKCEKSVLAVLLERREGGSIDELASAAGYEVSGGFRNALTTLRTAGVMVGKNTGTMKASDELLE